jgi:hypothetical protein
VRHSERSKESLFAATNDAPEEFPAALTFPSLSAGAMTDYRGVIIGDVHRSLYRPWCRDTIPPFSLARTCSANPNSGGMNVHEDYTWQD